MSGIVDAPRSPQGLRRFWYDSVNGYGPSLRCACDALGSDRIVFGTDYPYWRNGAHRLACDYVANSGLGAQAVAAVERENALALFAGRIRA